MTQQPRPLDVLILAAGQGTRMNSALPKVLHPIAGRPMVAWAVKAAQELGARKVVVVTGHGAEQVEALDNQVPTEAQTSMYLEFRRLLDRAMRWFVTSRPASMDIGSEIERFRPAVRELSPKVPDMLSGAERERWERSVEQLLGGTPAPTAIVRSAG